MSSAIILALISLLNAGITYVAQLKKNAQTTAGWTDEESAAVDTAWDEKIKTHPWLTDAEGG